MKRVRNFLLPLLMLSLPAFAQESQVEANKQLRTSIQKWIATMQEITVTRKNWDERRELLSESKGSLSTEVQDIQQDIEATQVRLKGADADSIEKIAKKDSYDVARKAFQAGLDGVEEKVSAVIAVLPPELASEPKMAKAILDHQNYVAAEDKSKKLNSRLTAMLTILNISEKFNQVVTTYEDRTAKAGGTEVQIDKVYFGLAFGFAANADGTMAFRLTPSQSGWVSSPIDDGSLASQIRRLIDVASGSGETQLVTLPLEIAQ